MSLSNRELKQQANEERQLRLTAEKETAKTKAELNAAGRLLIKKELERDILEDKIKRLEEGYPSTRWFKVCVFFDRKWQV